MCSGEDSGELAALSALQKRRKSLGPATAAKQRFGEWFEGTDKELESTLQVGLTHWGLTGCWAQVIRAVCRQADIRCCCWDGRLGLRLQTAAGTDGLPNAMLLLHRSTTARCRRPAPA